MTQGGYLSINYAEIDRLLKAMQDYQGDTEDAINDVLHNYAGNRAQTDIYRFMPVSKKSKGKHAKASQSLSNVNGNLSVTVTARGKWHYLYFPDDGTNTYRHAGNQRFFERGGEAAMNDIVDRCVSRLTNDFEKGV